LTCEEYSYRILKWAVISFEEQVKNPLLKVT
jgi:hypothetical protein